VSFEGGRQQCRDWQAAASKGWITLSRSAVRARVPFGVASQRQVRATLRTSSWARSFF